MREWERTNEDRIDSSSAKGGGNEKEPSSQLWLVHDDDDEDDAPSACEAHANLHAFFTPGPLPSFLPSFVCISLNKTHERVYSTIRFPPISI